MSDDNNTTDHTALIESYFKLAHSITKDLEELITTEEVLLAIPAGEFNTENHKSAIEIRDALKEEQIQRLGSNEHILPYLTREQRKELGLLADKIRTLRREVHDLYVALVPKINMYESTKKVVGQERKL